VSNRHLFVLVYFRVLMPSCKAALHSVLFVSEHGVTAHLEKSEKSKVVGEKSGKMKTVSGPEIKFHCTVKLPMTQILLFTDICTPLVLDPESTVATWPIVNQSEATTVDRSIKQQSMNPCLPYWKSWNLVCSG